MTNNGRSQVNAIYLVVVSNEEPHSIRSADKGTPRAVGKSDANADY